MRKISMLILGAALFMAACDGSGPSPEGTLVVSTSTEGGDPDQDGYVLTVDGLDSLALVPTGKARIDLPAGRHTLRLLEVASHCSVAPGTSVEVDIPSRNATPLAFVINCPAMGVRVTTTTSGLDLDPDGYEVTANATEHAGAVPTNGTALTRLAPGSWTIVLTDVAPNCAFEGPASHTVTVVEAAVVPIEVAVICTAVTGVIGVLVEAAGIDLEGQYGASVDGAPHSVRRGGPTYLTGVLPGDHLVTLAVPGNCSMDGDPRSITLTAGGLMRDTVEVSFSVTCVARLGTLRIVAATTGTIPPGGYSAWSCESGFYCRFYPYLLGSLPPNGTLLVPQVQPGSYELWLEDVPSICGLVGPTRFTIAAGDTLDLGFNVACP